MADPVRGAGRRRGRAGDVRAAPRAEAAVRPDRPASSSSTCSSSPSCAWSRSGTASPAAPSPRRPSPRAPMGPQPGGTTTRRAIATAAPRPVSALGFTGRFAIYDPDLLDTGDLSDLDPPDVNAIIAGPMPRFRATPRPSTGGTRRRPARTRPPEEGRTPSPPAPWRTGRSTSSIPRSCSPRRSISSPARPGAALPPGRRVPAGVTSPRAAGHLVSGPHAGGVQGRGAGRRRQAGRGGRGSARAHGAGRHARAGSARGR